MHCSKGRAWNSTLHTALFPLHTFHLHFALHTPHFTLHTALFALHTSLHAALLGLHTSHFTVHTSHFSLLSSLSTLHTTHCTLPTPHFTSRCALRTPHFTLHSPHFTLHTSYCFLHTPHFSLHTPHFTLHSSHCALHAPHFTLHSSHSTLQITHFISSELFSPYPSSSLLICHLSFHESLPSTTRACMRRAPARPVRVCVCALCKAVAVLLPKNMTCARPRCNATPTKTFLTLHTAVFTPCTSHFTLALFAFDTSSHVKSCDLFSPHLSSSHLIPSPLTCHLSNTSWSHLSSSQLFSSHPSTVSTQKLVTQMQLHFTQEKPLKSIFVLQSLAHLPSSSVSPKKC